MASNGEILLFSDGGKTLIPGNQKVTYNGRAFANLARQTYPAGDRLGVDGLTGSVV